VAVKKRITRKQLLKEPDSFMTFSGKAIAFLRANQSQIGYALAGVVVVVIGFAIFWYFSSRSEDKAYALLYQGLSHYSEASAGGQGEHFDQVARESLGRLVKEYGSTTAGKVGWPLYGDVSYRATEFDDAVAAYENALKVFPDAPAWRPLIWNSLAYAYEGKKDFESAIQCWEKVVGFEGRLAKGEAYFNLGRMYEAKKNVQKAREAYEKVADEFPDSVHADVARGKLEKLEG
jgi:tetratricopeptide (TPR) repeat protein